MTIARALPLLMLLLLPQLLDAQGSASPIGGYADHLVDRLSVKSGLATRHFNSLRPYLRGDLATLAIQLDTQDLAWTPRDRFDLQHLLLDNNEWLVQGALPTTIAQSGQRVYRRVYVDSSQTFYTLEARPSAASTESPYYQRSSKPLLKYFYRSPANFFEIDEKFFHLRINPILNIRYGRDGNVDDPIFYNRRGVELRGGIDDRIYFYTNILETQARFPEYVRERIGLESAVPGAGFYKNYQSSVFNIDQGQDFLLSQGYLGFHLSPHVGVQFGHGRNFIGNGYRSLFLSDYANNYFYLKLNTRVWKFHYQNIFAELNAESLRDNPGNNVLDRKYMVAHYLTYRPIPQLRLGIFETVIYHREGQFELQYLNPVILYRTIEQGLDSPDNILIGLDFAYDFFKTGQLYGQLMLDEFVFNELLVERRGWWANKYGFQLGIKYFDALGIDHLDLQAEINVVRPYTYQHRDSASNYTHTVQSLAHPLGANFREFLVQLRYPILDRLVLNTRLILAQQGEDDGSFNYGGDLILDYGNRRDNFGNETLQGVRSDIVIAGIDLSYQLFHNVFIDLSYFYRNKTSQESVRDRTDAFIEGGIRMNINQRRLDF
ncbi:MAG: capsule assembly Wzi family protein [Bacteroidota bacterium]